MASAASSVTTRSAKAVAATVARGGDGSRELGQLTIELGHSGGEQVDPVVTGLQAVQPEGRFRAPGDHLVDRRPVLASQAGERRPAPRDPLQTSRLGVQGVEISGQISRHVGQQVARLGQPTSQLVELLIRGGPIEHLAGQGDLGERSPGLVVCARDRPEGRLGRLPEVVRGLQPQGLGGQREVLPRLAAPPARSRPVRSGAGRSPGLGPGPRRGAGRVRSRRRGVRRRACGSGSAPAPARSPANRSRSCRGRSAAARRCCSD